MGATCCTSEASAAARRGEALESDVLDGVKVEVEGPLKSEGTPLWLQQLQEAKLAAAREPPEAASDAVTAEAGSTPLSEEEASPESVSRLPSRDKASPESVPRLPSKDKVTFAAAEAAEESAGEATESAQESACEQDLPRVVHKAQGKARAKSRQRLTQAQAARASAAKGVARQAALQPQAAKEVPERASPKSKMAATVQKPTMGGALYHVLRITITSARGLRNADAGPGGKSDPYCLCEIPGEPSSRIKTPVIDDTLQPVWCHKAELVGFSNKDSLVFSVYDKDFLTADDTLGVARLGKEEIFPAGFCGELTLRRDLAKTEDKFCPDLGKLKVEVKVLRSYCRTVKVKPTVQEVKEDESQEEKREVTVTIYSGSNLPNADSGFMTGVSDPYCICEVPGRPNMVLRTPVASDTLDPVWNFTGKFHDFRMGDSMVFSVMDKDFIKADDLLGRVLLDADRILTGGYYGVLKLAHGGSIKVKVRVAEGEKGPVTAQESVVPAQEAGDVVEWTPQALLEAASKGDWKTVKQLLNAGVALDVPDSSGFTVLHFCVMKRQEDLLPRILQTKFKKRLVNMTTTDAKDTALHMAARKDHKAICAMLIKAGASTRKVNAVGKLPHQLAKGELAEWLRGEDPAGKQPPWQK